MIHVIHSSYAMHPMSYVHEVFPDEMAYLKWAKEAFTDMANSFDMVEELQPYLKDIARQIKEIEKFGKRSSGALIKPNIESEEFYSGVDCAGSWEEFAPCAIGLLIDELKLKQESDQEEDDEEASYDTIEEYLIRLEALSQRHDYLSQDFIDELEIIMKESMEAYLQHF